jgi:hypothetical protein
MSTQLCKCLAVAALLLALPSCSGDTTDDAGCAQACGAGKVCLGGTCVSAPLDAGDQIIPSGVDGGAGPGSYDAGPQSCAADKSLAQQQPLDIYIMLDQSSSMGETTATGQTKWEAVTAALATFLQRPLSGVSAGLQYFALPVCTVADCVTDDDCGVGCGPCEDSACTGYDVDESCSPADYATPDVEIAALPGVAQAIQDSIGRHGPLTYTPTGPALQGAVDHAAAWAQGHPGDVVIVILATDGEPTECDPQDIPDIAAIASTALAGDPPIRTFIIGIDDGSGNQGDLNNLAQAGGTDCGTGTCVDDPICADGDCWCDGGGANPACMVSTTTGDVNQQFLDALNQIRGAALGCNYLIPTPASGTPDYGKVNVQYTPGGGVQRIIPQVQDKALCPLNQDGWYYDNPTTPTQIILCDTPCSQVEGDPQGEVDVLLGCQTIIN